MKIRRKKDKKINLKTLGTIGLPILLIGGYITREIQNRMIIRKTFEIAEDNEETYSSMMKLSWVNSISKSIIEFINCIDSKKANIVEQQYLISAIETWGELSRELGQSKIIQPYKKNAIKINDLKGGKNE